MALRDWPAVLRAAGISVQVHPEVNRLSHGTLRDHNIVWHHDASPPGDSPGALNWMKSNFKNSSAQIWVDRKGVWHFISYGIAWHAGAVNDSRWNNYNSVGIETDHTVGEAWPAQQIDSLRRGTAVVLKHERKDASALAFHKTICVPRGRKSDPDGLDLATERGHVLALQKGTAAAATTAPTIVPEEDMTMMSRLMRAKGDSRTYLVQGLTRRHVPNPQRLADLRYLNREAQFLNDKAGEVREVAPEVLEMFVEVK